MKDVEQRFWNFVNKEGRLMPGMLTRCWEWTGALHGGTGGRYGQLNVEKKLITAHRLAWELFVDQIPLGLDIHHICNNPICVNPEHLVLVRPTGHSNLHSILRRTCRNGHPYDEENPLIDGKGYRRCRLCAAESRRRYAERRKVKS